MLVVVALDDDPDRTRADGEAGAARHLAAIAREHHLVVTYGFGSPPGPTGLERAMSGLLPDDRLATLPTRIVLGPDGLPRSIVELRTFRILVDGGVTVLCPGDACIPVARAAAGGLRTPVVESDLVAGRLATELDADALLLLTDTEAEGDAGGDARDRTRATAAKLRTVGDFVDAGGWLGAVGALPDAAGMLDAGPGVVRGGHTVPPVATADA